MSPIIAIIGFLVLFLLFSGLFTVKQQTAAIIQRLGKFHSIRQSGLQFKIPVIDAVAGRINLKIQQLDVNVETKTFQHIFKCVIVNLTAKRSDSKRSARSDL